MNAFDVVEMSIGEMREALDAGVLTSIDLVCAYVNRIAYYDRTGLCLHAIAVLNPDCLREAAESDRRRREGNGGPLEGIPFTVKDSYKVKGMTVASGSPALADLVATEDAASVALLRAAGAVLLGKTNMPPMAAGGIQPGVYDYARSPYNPDYITAAYGSGSSNGSGTATAASMCAFGMAEETVSSGRAPASNNALVAYTPSRGVISIRGNWPLRPTCDVVVPHTRTIDDLVALLEVLAVDDDDPTGDFWRLQNTVELPSPAEVLPRPLARQRPRAFGWAAHRGSEAVHRRRPRTTRAARHQRQRATALAPRGHRSARSRCRSGRGGFSRRIELRRGSAKR
ncbi:amidase family protein [Microbacterium marmarense]|uniref:Amidase family protein n=1 Tax=Microbacterium marmarense TaxID=3122051 RepID=A0ABU8LT84_9MICO